MKGCVLICSFILFELVHAIQTCPFNIFQSGFSNDAVNMLNLLKSSPPHFVNTSTYNNGVCGAYRRVLTANGTHRSSFDVFDNTQQNVVLGIFNIEDDDWVRTIDRDTIHLSPPQFLGWNSSTEYRSSSNKLRGRSSGSPGPPPTPGLVVSKFQDMFQHFLENIPDTFYTDVLRDKRLILASYGVGGSMNTFMATYLHHQHNITVKMLLNFGSPFIADREFDETILSPLREIVGSENWWNMEVTNILNGDVRDTTPELFNRNTKPFIYINWSVLCVAYILPYYDVDIHSPLNYKTPLIGFNCQ